MARLLIVGGSSHRALALTRTLVSQGYSVRTVTRTAENRQVLEEAGCECWFGDPNVIGTIRDALDHVTILCWFLGNATGELSATQALHGSRLRMMLERSIDTTVRGFIYEANGSLPKETLDRGCQEVAHARTVHGIPCEVVTADPREQQNWQTQVQQALKTLLAE